MTIWKSSPEMRNSLATISAGDKFGDLTVVQRVADNTHTRTANLIKRVRVQCVCGKRETIPTYYLVRPGNPKTHCGCRRKTIKTLNNEIYRIWNMMHVRCEYEKHEAYKHYGGRGIKVCWEWQKANPDGLGFQRFLEYIGPRPSPNHSIDRVDNNLGYQPFQADGVTRQVRWATAKEQRANQRPYSNGSR